MSDVLKAAEDVAQAVSEAEAAPDFDYEQPKEVQFFILVDQAGQHANVRTRLLPQIAAAKLNGHEQEAKLVKEAAFHKLAIGRLWLAAKALGYDEVRFRAALDAHLRKGVEQFQA